MLRPVGCCGSVLSSRFTYMYLPLPVRNVHPNNPNSNWPVAWMRSLNVSTCVKRLSGALLNRLFKDVSNYEIVKVLTPHFTVAKHAGGADLECGLQTSTTHDGHNSIHSQLRLGEGRGPQDLPLIPCHVCGRLLFSKVNQWFSSVSTHNFLYCYHLWMILECCNHYFPFSFL